MVLPAVERKTVISQYDHFVFNKGNVSTYNGKLFFSHPVETDIECSVVASDMLEVLKTIDSPDMEMVLTGKTLNVLSADVEANLSTEVHEDSVVQAITSMNLDSVDWDTAQAVPADFITGIEYCQFSVSKDASNVQNLFNIHVFENVIESCDGFRCSEYIMDGKMDEVLIPSSSSIVLAKQKPQRYVLTGGWIHFIDADEVIFSVRVGEGDFPDIGRVIEVAMVGTEKVQLPLSLRNILGKFTNISDGTLDVYKFVQINIKDGKLLCSTKKETCNIKKTIDFPANDVEVEFFISPVFLSSIMEKTDTISINRENHMALFSVSNFTHVVTLPED